MKISECTVYLIENLYPLLKILSFDWYYRGTTLLMKKSLNSTKHFEPLIKY